MAITAKPRKFHHSGVMQRVVDEAEYVLTILHRMRNEARCKPESYDPDAQKRIGEAIARVEEVLRAAQPKGCIDQESQKAA
jgi:hypothetical protein